MGHDTAPNSSATRQRARATQPVCAATQRAVRATWGFCTSIQVLYRDKGAATRRYNACVRAATRQEAPATRRPGATIRRLVRHDMAPSARPGRSARSLGLGCAHCAPNPVLTLCTVLSHCLEHYLWTLFMNTGHGVFKKIKINK